jgi:poly(beta-D-mannuronate) lyase
MKRLLAALCLVLLVTAAAHAGKLRSPWDNTKINPTDAPYTCPAPPAFAQTLSAEGYYTDKKASVIDAQKLAVFNTESEGPTHLGQFAGLAADAWLSKGSKAAAACVYALLDAAAKADAWDGKMPQIVGVYLQNWMLSGTAIPYLKVRDSGVGTPEQDAEIQRWFALVAARVRDYFDMQRNRPSSDAYNNHMYWAGLAVAAQGIAANDQDAFIWGLTTFRMGVDAIQPDGALTAEMNRAAMAEHYQLYALGPLVMLAELGAANGLDLYAENKGAIHRLVKFTVTGREDPSIIEKRTGAPQNLPADISGLEIGWAVPYVKRFPDPQLSAMIAKAPWVRFWQWGGAPPEPEIPRPQPSAAQTAFEADLQRNINGAISAQFPDASQLAAFFGMWCGQGIPEVRASITHSGDYLILRNENGDASAGRASGRNSIIALGWQNVIGTLSPGGTQIDWTNGTFWERCDAARGSEGSGPINLSGQWYADSDRTQPCSVRQQGDELKINCGKWGRASGQMDGDHHLTTSWSGKTITATVTADGNHLNWDNSTYWTRSTVYRSSSR